MLNSIKLKELDKNTSYTISLFLVTMGIGIFTGLYFVYLTTDMTPKGTVEQYRGSEVINNNDIPDKFKKPIESMVMTTHDHINTFAIISFLLGIIFYFNSIIVGKLKFFLLIEPYFSIIITFSSMWLMRFCHPNFVYIMMISAVLMYSIWYIMILVSLYELLIFKK
tara:strand:+ start:48 stop:545 length:498 start_codon:yes stop_codon:yes gene_type:complete